MSAKPLGIMGGPVGPHNDAMCVVVCGTCWFCIWSGEYLSAGDPIWSGKSPTGTMLVFSGFFFFFCFSRFARNGLCTNNQQVKCAVLHNLPKAFKQLRHICK